MPRPLWKGAVQFGMVTIPIKVYTGTEEKDVHFNQLHIKDMSRIRQNLLATVVSTLMAPTLGFCPAVAQQVVMRAKAGDFEFSGRLPRASPLRAMACPSARLVRDPPPTLPRPGIPGPGYSLISATQTYGSGWRTDQIRG